MNIIKKHYIKISFYLLFLLGILVPMVINKIQNNKLDRIEISPLQYSAISKEYLNIINNPKYNPNQKRNVKSIYLDIKSDGKISVLEKNKFKKCCKDNFII